MPGQLVVLGAVVDEQQRRGLVVGQVDRAPDRDGHRRRRSRRPATSAPAGPRPRAPTATTAARSRASPAPTGRRTPCAPSRGLAGSSTTSIVVAARHGEAVLDALQRPGAARRAPSRHRRARNSRPPRHGAVALQGDAGDARDRPGRAGTGRGRRGAWAAPVRTARSSGRCGPCAPARRGCRRRRTARCRWVRTRSRSSPDVDRTRSSRRVKASSTWPPRTSRSATTIAASTSVGSAAAAARAAARSTPSVRCMRRTWASPSSASWSLGFSASACS